MFEYLNYEFPETNIFPPVKKLNHTIAEPIFHKIMPGTKNQLLEC